MFRHAELVSASLRPKLNYVGDPDPPAGGPGDVRIPRQFCFVVVYLKPMWFNFFLNLLMRTTI